MDTKGKVASGFLFYIFCKSKAVQTFKNNTTFLLYNFDNIVLYKNLYQSLVLTNFYTTLRLIPYVSNKITEGISSATEGLSESLNKYDSGIEEIFTSNNVNIQCKNNIPKINSEVQLITLLEQLRENEKSKIANNKVSGTIYADTTVGQTKRRTELFLSRIFHLYYLTNPLHPDVFPTLRFIERNLINFTLKLFNADLENGRGILTTGGTESIFLACKAYRDYAKKVKKVDTPEMIVPNTIHPAFDKAAHYLGIKIMRIPYCYKKDRLDTPKIYKMINRNTVMVALSAPNFPYGTCDPISTVAKITKKYDVPLHVDACLGGFVLAFLENNSNSSLLPKKFNYDFSIPGVTSVSADYHKYALCPKGSSIVMYNSRKYADYQYFVQPDWCGGIYATNSFTGSKSGNISLMTWATIVLNGTRFYKTLAKSINNSTCELAEKLNKIPNVTVIGEPCDLVNVVAFYTDPKFCHISAVNHSLKQKGYNLNELQKPDAVHLAVTENHTNEEFKKQFIIDVIVSVREATIAQKEAMDKGMPTGAAIYGTSQKISDSSIIDKVARNYLDLLYS
jgi:sphinganine-1-phosphate aldolase